MQKQDSGDDTDADPPITAPHCCWPTDRGAEAIPREFAAWRAIWIRAATIQAGLIVIDPASLALAVVVEDGAVARLFGVGGGYAAGTESPYTVRNVSQSREPGSG